MANHKRKRPASTRAGCKLCKPYKDQRFSKPRAQREIAGKGGFGKLRKLRAAAQDMKDFTTAVGNALRRAAKDARKIARMHGTRVYVWRNGKIVAEKP